MKHYLFTDKVTGEDFIVGEYCIEMAYLEAKLYFDDPLFICELTEDEAEASGLDEY
jgi:hypothetical protein